MSVIKIVVIYGTGIGRKSQERRTAPVTEYDELFAMRLISLPEKSTHEIALNKTSSFCIKSFLCVCF